MAAYQLDANPQWIKIASFTEASISIAAVTATVTCDPLQLKGGGGIDIHGCRVIVDEVFDGAGTVQVDVGKSGSLKIYAKDINVKGATGRFDGFSSITTLKTCYAETAGHVPVVTITSGSGNISTFTTGKASVWLLVSAAP